MGLHIKHRPKVWDDFKGNAGVISSLKTIVKKVDTPHSFLFTGPSGTGKTTLAYILANSLSIHKDSITCCNASKDRGIDSIRDLLNKAKYKTRKGNRKAYILDEVHGLTKESQNALLEALENTPKHVYFILCTTDPQKIIPAIHTRCTSYKVNYLSDVQVGELLDKVVDMEKKELTTEVKNGIIDASEGCPRECLKILDQVIDMQREDALVVLEAMKDTQGQDKHVVELCRLLNTGASWCDVSKVISCLKGDWEQFRYAILGYMAAALLRDGDERVSIIIANFSESFIYTKKAGMVLACYSSTGG